MQDMFRIAMQAELNRIPNMGKLYGMGQLRHWMIVERSGPQGTVLQLSTARFVKPPRLGMAPDHLIALSTRVALLSSMKDRPNAPAQFQFCSAQPEQTRLDAQFTPSQGQVSLHIQAGLVILRGFCTSYGVVPRAEPRPEEDDEPDTWEFNATQRAWRNQVTYQEVTQWH
ncbi:hypothetical protein BFP70_03515 [Thioclava sp. SK-1]|uniref:hypothetical protein n=1 Tax=Thioclava sp. SK-1 TaxID=1889770 RepID=UPI000824E33E|nr:hypothetical protein [Thioclava sp. SK-1]OCX66907.1 hypothetical protein BFP70_03515 [Thioclava sp. SK-1]